MTTTETNNPQAIRDEIAETRAQLSQNVNALGGAVTPSNIAKRQAQKVGGAAVGLKDKVMGSAESAGSSVSGKAGSVTGSMGDVGSGAMSRTQGSPVAAGIIALGAGWLLGSMMPATRAEQQAADRLKEQATPLVDQAKGVAQEAAQETAENLKQPALDAADSVKTSAQDAAATIMDEGQSAVEDVRSSAQDSKENVQQHQQRPGTSL